MAYLESLPEDPEDDELSELDPEPLEEDDDFSRSSSTFPAILNVQKKGEDACSPHLCLPARSSGCHSMISTET